MKRTLFSLFLISIVVITFGLHAIAQHGAMMRTEGDEIVCPVTNRVMKKSESQVSYTMYFASEPAKEAFIKNPVKFLTATCPVMDGEANKLTAPYSNYDGVAYFHCCAGCKEMFQKEPKKYIGKTPKKSEMDTHSEMKGKSTTSSAVTCAASCPGCNGAEVEKNLMEHTCGMSQKSDVLGHSAVKTEETAFTDPVCGMEISSKDGVQGKYKGTDYHFCSDQCKDTFEKEPEEYIKK